MSGLPPLLSLLLLVGCDRVFDIGDVDPSGSRSDGGGAACKVGAPFGAGSPVRINGTYSVEGARFDATQTIAYLSLCPTTGAIKDGCDLYTAQYFQDTGFSLFQLLHGVSTDNVYDAYPTVTPDGQYLLFGSERVSPVHVFIATAANGSFDTPSALDMVSLIPGGDFGNEPYVLPDGKTLYLSGGQNGSSTRSDLYRASGPAPGFGGVAQLVPGVNGASEEFAPVVTDDEREIFFASDRQATSDSDLDIYTATRDSVGASFGAPHRIDALSSTGDTDWPLWISRDACELYYIRKPASSGIGTLYMSRR